MRRTARLLRALAVPIASALALGCASAPRPAAQAPRVAWEPQRWGDARFQSAWLVRAAGRAEEAPPLADADELERLRRHFAAVEERLAADAPRSLEVALARLEASRGGFDRAEREAWRGRLARRRAEQIERLRGYAARGVFPRNESRAPGWVPIFVDAHDTACAVGFLMRESGRADAVAAIAREQNGIYVPDARDGPLVGWALTSGLTLEEAALIQPAYAPPPAQTNLAALGADGSLQGGGLVYDHFDFEASVGRRPGWTPPSECQGGTLPAETCDPAYVPPFAAVLPVASQVGLAARQGGYTPPGFGRPLYNPTFERWLFVGGDEIGELGAFYGSLSEIGVSMLVRIAFDVRPLDPLQVIGGASLVSDLYTSGNYARYDGESMTILRSQIFRDDDPLPAVLGIGDQQRDYYPGVGIYPFVDSLDASESALFAPAGTVHVEFEAVLDSPFQLTSVIHEFHLVPVPEPGTLALAAFGLAALAALGRRRSAGALSRSGARARRSGRGAGAARSGAPEGDRRPRA